MGLCCYIVESFLTACCEAVCLARTDMIFYCLIRDKKKMVMMSNLWPLDMIYLCLSEWE